MNTITTNVFGLMNELHELADLHGLLTEYEDVHRRRQPASAESLLAVLRALNVPVHSRGDVPAALERRRRALLERGVEPVIVAWDGQGTPFTLHLPTAAARGTATCRLLLEGGSDITQRIDLKHAASAGKSPEFVAVKLTTPHGLERGYHRLRVETPAEKFEALVISAPSRAYSPHDDGGANWGCFLPLYALRSARNWGAGDFTDLAALAKWVGGWGGHVVGTLPLLAAQLDDPCDPSPYAPLSRLFWNEFYMDVTATPEFRNCPAAQSLASAPEFTEQVESLRHAEFVDYARVMAIKRQVLEAMAAHFFRSQSARREEYQRFIERRPQVEDYARFRAAGRRLGKSWRDWPAEQRGGELKPGDYHQAEMRYWSFAQWLADEQIERLAHSEASGGAALYLDLPLGVRPDGYDVWRHQEVYASSASAGAPPDAVWTKGQDWGFAPLDPEAVRQDGYRHVRSFLAHFLQHTRLLRIDHVMSLHRLYWIPAGFPADQGVYVRYHPDELYAVLSLESHRRQARIVGENLGTVPVDVDEAMQRHHVRRMYVVQYELEPENESPLDEPPRQSVASLNTHDMPPFAGWWNAGDIADRLQLDLLDAKAAEEERKSREEIKGSLAGWLRQGGWLEPGEGEESQDVMLALTRFLAASPAELALINLEDLWGEEQPQNTPGTGDELPNWRRKARLSLEEMREHEKTVNVLREIARTDPVHRVHTRRSRGTA